MLALVIVHGMFWSGLLSASAAYMTSMLPERRRAEGHRLLGAVDRGGDGRRADDRLLDLQARLDLAVRRVGGPEPRDGGDRVEPAPGSAASTLRAAGSVVAVTASCSSGACSSISLTLFLYSFGYGGITSFTALYADANGVTPKSIYLTTLAIVILVTRPFAGRLGDRLGYKRVFVPCLVLICLGLALLAIGGTRGWMLASAIVFGVGFGTAYPVYVGYVMQRRHRRPPRRRLRRDPRGVRHRHRHRLDDDGLADSALRLRVRVRLRGRAVRARPAVFPDRRSLLRHGSHAAFARRKPFHRRVRQRRRETWVICANGVTTWQRRRFPSARSRSRLALPFATSAMTCF